MPNLTDNEIHERLNALIARRTKGMRIFNTRQLKHTMEYEVSDVQ